MMLSNRITELAREAALRLKEQKNDQYIQIEGAAGMFIAHANTKVPDHFTPAGTIELGDEDGDGQFTIYIA